MDKKKLKLFGDRLAAKREEVTKGFNRSKAEANEEAQSGSEDFVDYAVNAYTKEFLLSLSDLDRRVLLLVDDALVRIQKGQFGVCLECEKPIGDKRLEAVPWTPYCISCQERVEAEESGIPQAPQRPFLD